MGTTRDTRTADVLTAAVAQVRDGDGSVLGTGFLIGENLLISCAHVLADGGYGPGDAVQLVFPRVSGVPSPRGRVLEEGWRAPDEQDIALVLLDEVPAGVVPLSLGSSAGCAGRQVRSLGFPVQAPPDGHFGSAEVLGLLPAPDSADDMLQLTGANDLTTGFSGGPVLDEVAGRVVGMVSAITAPDGHDRGHGIAYATPAEVLRDAWPALRVLDVSPYQALAPFTSEQARWFHGREDAVRRLVDALAGGERTVLLLGPSGAGKSSLVQAGLLPALARGEVPGSDRWRQVVARPGPNLPAVLEQAGLPATAPSGVRPAATGSPGDGPDPVRTVLVIDQFEEILAPSTEPLTAALATITGAIRSLEAADVVLVIVMRDDFYPRLSALAPELLRAALKTRGVLNVPATLTSADLNAIVTGPAADLKVAFEAGLAPQIVSDVLALNPRTAGAREAPVTVLPMLEVALSQLWDRRLDHDGMLTHDAYRRIGAVTGALADWCGAALRELDDPQRLIAQRALTALVRPADEALNIPAARQRFPLLELRELSAADGTPEALEAVDAVLEVLSRHRIITTDRVHEPRAADGSVGTPMAELIHDTLIRDWPELRRWAEQDARFHGWLHRARTSHARWQKHRELEDLPAGTLLAEGTDWERHRRLPTELARFLDAGRHREQAAMRRSRRLNTVLATMLALALIASGVAIFQWRAAVTAKQAVQEQQLMSRSRQFSAESTSLLGTEPNLASRLAIAAYRTSPTSEAADALRAAAAVPLRRSINDSRPVKSVVFSPDGRTLAAGAFDGVGLWDMATGRKTATFAAPVTSVAFSPDSAVLAMGGGHGTVRLWDVTVGRNVATFAGHTKPVNAVAFSPDGDTLATGGEDGTVRLWDVATGRDTATLTGHTEGVDAVVFSPDGDALATAGSASVPETGGGPGNSVGSVRLWDVATGESAATLPVPSRAPVFSPDGDTLATATAGIVRLWDTDTGRNKATLSGGDGDAVVFSPDGETLATAGSDRTARLWDADTGRITATFAGHSDRLTSVVFSPDGETLATAGSDSTARLWDVSTREVTATLTGHSAWVNAVVFSPDGETLATAGNDATVQVWDVSAAAFAAHLGSVGSVAFSPDGAAVATGSEDGTARLWEADTSTNTATLNGHDGAVDAVVFSPDGETLATRGKDRTARLWEADTGRMIASLTGPVDDMVFSTDGEVLATAAESESESGVHLWEADTGRMIASLTGPVDEMVFSPDGEVLATAAESESGVHLWEADTGRKTASLTGDPQFVNAVVFSPDGETLATAGNHGTVRLWDVGTGRNTATLTGHTAPVASVVFSPGGDTLASAGEDGTARLWDADTGRNTATLTGHVGHYEGDREDSGPAPASVDAVVFSPDGGTLATTALTDRTVRLWDVRTGGHTATLTGHTSSVDLVAFSPSGETLATAGAEGTVRLWDVATARSTATFTGHDGAVHSLVFSPDGDSLATVSANVRLWHHIAPATAISALCGTVARDLTRKEEGSLPPDLTACPGDPEIR
ncbi:hypothetical protein G3I48_08190 [Streptomyces griseus]|uniref:nSTAND1 domain-containing NTPase n=1 Tax=Streptomyces griseus TaxID=1911 RepID=UPI0013BC790F|nr:hypothetical protein [Streptomyces griseus]